MGLDHRQRGGIRRRRAAPDLAQDGPNLGKLSQQAILDLKRAPRLRDRQSRYRGRHVENIALTHGRHELAAGLRPRHQCQREQAEGDPDADHLVPQRKADKRHVDPDHESIEGILGLGTDLPAHEVAREDGDHCDGDQGRGRHGNGLGKSQGLEQPPGLSFQGEDRHERNGHHQQRHKQTRADLLGRLADQLPVIRVRRPFLVFVKVFDDHDRGIDDRTDGHGDARDRHDVGIDAGQLHDDERSQDPQGKDHRGHQGASHMPQKEHADQGGDD